MNPDDIERAFGEAWRAYQEAMKPTAEEHERLMAEFRAMCERVDNDPAEQRRIDRLISELDDDSLWANGEDLPYSEQREAQFQELVTSLDDGTLGQGGGYTT